MKQKVLAAVFIIIFFTLQTQAKPMATDNYKYDLINCEWWKNFNDEYLMNYIYRTIENNHILKAAELKTKEAEQSIKTQRANEFPSLSLFGNYARIKTPKADFNGVDFDSTGTDTFALPLVMSYEADIFLKKVFHKF